jgi:hypothetical protein
MAKYLNKLLKEGKYIGPAAWMKLDRAPASAADMEALISRFPRSDDQATASPGITGPYSDNVDFNKGTLS